MITEGSTWFVISVLLFTFSMGALVMWVVAEVQLRKMRIRLAAAQFHSDKAAHWERMAEIEADRAASIKTEARIHRSKREALEAENQRLRRRWDDGVLFMKDRTVHHLFLESHINAESAAQAVAESLVDEIAADMRSRIILTREDVLDGQVLFRAVLPAKPFMLPAEEVDHG